MDDDPVSLSLQEEVSKAEEEARSQDSGYEPEDQCDGKKTNEDPPATLTLRLPVDKETLKLIQENGEDSTPEMGVVTRVPRQDSSKCVKKDIQTQTEKKKSAPAEDKDSSSADEVLTKNVSSSNKKSDKTAKTESSSEPKIKPDNDESSKGES